MLDKNKDKKISMEEIDSLTDVEMELAAKLFPMFYNSEEEEEGDGDDEKEELTSTNSENESLDSDEDEDLPKKKKKTKSELWSETFKVSIVFCLLVQW